jgi:DNA-binding YbaB/EbfC family protein
LRTTVVPLYDTAGAGLWRAADVRTAADVLGRRAAVARVGVAVGVNVGVGVATAVDDGGTDADRGVAGGGELDRDGPPELQPAMTRATNGSTDSGRRRTAPPLHAPADRRASGAPVRVLDRPEPADDAEERGTPVAQRGGQFGGGGQPNMQQLLKQAQKMQEELAAAQAELAAAEVTGTAGGGLVTATLTGGGELTALTIDPKAVDPDDVETLQDLIVAAVRDAHRAVGELAAEKMGPVTGGMGGLGDSLGGLGLPGL